MCKTCATPQKFKTKNILKEHVRRLHDGRRDVIKLGKSTRYLSKNKVQTEGSKRVGSTLCEDMFTCQQNLEEHKELEHGLNILFKCNMVPKMFCKRN